jgi:hypothetical protein
MIIIFWEMMPCGSYNKFSFKKCKNRKSLLIERENVIPCCAIFLRALKYNKSEPKKPVEYTDVT